MSYKDEIISAFAYNTGKKIEELIKKQTDNLEETNNMLEAKIFQWYSETRDEKFAIHFGIKEIRSGKV